MDKFSRFEEIEYGPLRDYNRVVMTFNIQESFGVEAAKEYVATFTQPERKAMAIVTLMIKTHGKEATQKLVTKGLEVVE